MLQIHAQNYDTLTVVSYNLLNFPNGRNDCGANIQPTDRYDTLRKIVAAIKPDILMVCELHAAGEALILSNSLNVNGVTYYAKANFVGNGTGDILHNMMYYNSDKLSLKSQTEIDFRYSASC